MKAAQSYRGRQFDVPYMIEQWDDADSHADPPYR